MKIIYVHHGQRLKGNTSTQNDDLTTLGYQDCELVADLLNDDKIKNNIKAIYTSPYFRCKKTANIINKHLNTDIIEDNRLNEYTGKENETWLQAQERLLNCINCIIEKYNNEDIVICVTSGVNIAAFICEAFNIPPTDSTPFLGVPSCSPIMFDYKK